MINNISIGIFIHDKVKEECNTLKNTYLKYFENYLFFGSKNDPNLPVYTSESITLNDDYNSATPKQFLCLKKQFELHKNCDWFFIAGYDTYLHPVNAVEMLKNQPLDEPMLVGGHGDIRYTGNKKLYFPSGGPGIFLNKKCLSLIYDKLEIYGDEWKETSYGVTMTPFGTTVGYPASDTALAYFIKRDLKVSCTEVPGMYFLNYDSYKEYPEFGKQHHNRYKLISKPVSFHRLTPPSILMNDLHQRALNGEHPFTSCKLSK
jgi:hypothetical protein